MASQKAQAAKQKGNDAFKSGDYPTAIGHYTAAMLADRADATFPLNRAAAYLKLGKNEDAERDCTAVLGLSPGNVKALFRRAQARVAMERLEDAQKDLVEAARLEPANAPVKEELGKVLDLIQKQKTKALRSAPSSLNAPTTPSPRAAPKRRRVPITIVEPDKTPPATLPATPKAKDPSTIIQPPSKNDLLSPVSSRPLAPSPADSQPKTNTTIPSAALPPAPTSAPAATTKTASFKDVKQARESRVGGGIFRASGKNTIFTRGEAAPGSVTATSVSTPAAADATTTTSADPNAIPALDSGTAPKSGPLPATVAVSTDASAPMTLFDFSRAWEGSGSMEERWELISRIPPARIPAMLKASLEPALLASILKTFLSVLGRKSEGRDVVTAVRAYMESFEKVPRFGTVVLFLSQEERVSAKEVWKQLGVARPGGVWGVLGGK